MAKVEAIKRTKIRRAELVQLYKEDKEWDAWPNKDDTVNKEDDDKPPNTELEAILRNFLKNVQCWILVI